MTSASLQSDVQRAVKRFWRVRRAQEKKKSDSASGDGGRRAVTGGKQLDGFEDLLARILARNGVPKAAIYRKGPTRSTLPGFFRPTKQWDLLVVANDELIASIELKSHVGSFGNNFNNRVEEAIGNALDLHTAYREGAYGISPRPWIGYLMLLEDAPESTRPLTVREPHFAVRSEFKGATYAQRYELFCHKLVREGLYDAVWFVLSAPDGSYSEPNPELSAERFITSLAAHASAQNSRSRA